jgi:uncharacterized protein (DUF952 family)
MVTSEITFIDDKHGADVVWPRIMGPLNVDAVSKVVDLVPDADGLILLPSP